jgi:hypothetical protein
MVRMQSRWFSFALDGVPSSSDVLPSFSCWENKPLWWTK